MLPLPPFLYHVHIAALIGNRNLWSSYKIDLYDLLFIASSYSSNIYCLFFFFAENVLCHYAAFIIQNVLQRHSVIFRTAFSITIQCFSFIENIPYRYFITTDRQRSLPQQISKSILHRMHVVSISNLYSLSAFSILCRFLLQQQRSHEYSYTHSVMSCDNSRR